jgi:hypothetical protein
MIFYSIFYFSPSTIIPGVFGLIPTIGTALVIGFTNDKTLVKSFLSSRILVFFGLISYSLYLWHQPIFAFGRLAFEDTRRIFPYLILTTFILSILSYLFIEKPFRNRLFISTRFFFILVISVAALLFLCGYSTVYFKGFENRFQQDWLGWSNHKSNTAYVYKRANSLEKDFENNQTKKILIVGDSFSQDLVNEIYENKNFSNFQIRTLKIIADCQTYYGPYDEKVQIKNKIVCKKIQQSLVSKRMKDADMIIFASAWRDWSAIALKDTLERLDLRSTQKILIIGTKFFGKVHYNSLSKLNFNERIKLKKDVSYCEQIKINKILSKSFPNNIIIPTSLICSTNGKKIECPLFTPKGDLITYDGSHLTKEGARYLGSKLLEDDKFKRFLYSSNW